MKPALRVLHLMTGTGVGGAEAMLLALCREPRWRGRISNAVLSLKPPGELFSAFEAAVPTASLSFGGDAAFLTRRRQVRRAIRKSGADVVCAWLPQAHFITYIASPYKLPCVWVFSGDPRPAKARRGTRFVAWANRTSIDRADAVICVGANQAARLRAMSPVRADKLAMIPNGFTPADFVVPQSARRRVRADLELAPEAPLVGFFGRNHSAKGTALLRELVAPLGARGISLLVMGSGFPCSTLDAAHVYQRGAVPRDDLPPWYAACDLVIVPSLSEAFGNVACESLLSGVDVLVSDTGELASIAGASAVVAGRDATVWAERISRYFSTPRPERQRVAELGRARIARNYAWNDMVDAYAQALEGAAVRVG